MSLVSVLMPMRNAEPFIRATLKSILAERAVDLEVVIIDDGSTDRSAAIVQSVGDPRVRLLPGPRSGIGAAFNTALAAAQGDLVARCDADDLYPPGRLAWQARWLEQHPEFGAVCGLFSTITPAGEHLVEFQTGSAHRAANRRARGPRARAASGTRAACPTESRPSPRQGCDRGPAPYDKRVVAEVARARHLALNRCVALKMILAARTPPRKT